MLFGDVGDGNTGCRGLAGAQAGDSAQGQRALPLGRLMRRVWTDRKATAHPERVIALRVHLCSHHGRTLVRPEVIRPPPAPPLPAGFR